MTEGREVWLWRYVDEHGKQRVTRYRLDRATALEQYGPSAQPVEGSQEVRHQSGNTSDFYRRP